MKDDSLATVTVSELIKFFEWTNAKYLDVFLSGGYRVSVTRSSRV